MPSSKDQSRFVPGERDGHDDGRRAAEEYPTAVPGLHIQRVYLVVAVWHTRSTLLHLPLFLTGRGRGSPVLTPSPSMTILRMSPAVPSSAPPPHVGMDGLAALRRCGRATVKTNRSGREFAAHV